MATVTNQVVLVLNEIADEVIAARADETRLLKALEM
jgi:hypothetical protein